VINIVFFSQVTALVKDASGFPATIGSTANYHLGVSGDRVATKIVEAACASGRESAKKATIKIGADGSLVS
jgi:predicted NAD/FAD-dependent oxidoreductase